MPQLSDLLEKKKFVKKSYRPWDLSGNGTIDSEPQQTSTTPTQPTVSTHLLEQERNIVLNHIVENTHTFNNPQINTIIPKTGTEHKTGNEIDNKTSNYKGTTNKQTGYKQVTHLKQPDNHKITKGKQQNNNSENNTDNTFGIHYLVEAIKKLSGIQKHIFLYIINLCSARGVLDTGNVLALDLANAGNCSIESAKTSLNRLIEKHLIIRHQGKACRGGHMVLGINNEIQSAAIQAQQALFNPLKLNHLDNNTGNNSNNNSYYSSSIYNNKTTTTILPLEWKNIKFDSLQSIGFSETQIRQLMDSQTTTPEIVQNSINHFSFALENKEKVKNYHEPLNVLMGVLRKGQNWHEPDYISPQELSLQNILKEKRKRKEKMETMIKELSDIEFPLWRKSLSPAEIKNIIPEEMLQANIAPAISATLRSYFTDNVLLPKLEQQGLLDF